MVGSLVILALLAAQGAVWQQGGDFYVSCQGPVADGSRCLSNCSGNGIGRCADGRCQGNWRGDRCATTEAPLAVLGLCSDAGFCDPRRVGDCDGDGLVAIGELIVGVGILLDRVVVAECRAATNEFGEVTVTSLVWAVGYAMRQ